MKKPSRKLKLAKETLRNLEANSLEDVFGGATNITICITTCITNCGFTACLSNCPGPACA